MRPACNPVCCALAAARVCKKATAAVARNVPQASPCVCPPAGNGLTPSFSYVVCCSALLDFAAARATTGSFLGLHMPRLMGATSNRLAHDLNLQTYAAPTVPYAAPASTGGAITQGIRSWGVVRTLRISNLCQPCPVAHSTWCNSYVATAAARRGSPRCPMPGVGARRSVRFGR